MVVSASALSVGQAGAPLGVAGRRRCNATYRAAEAFPTRTFASRRKARRCGSA
jgi:hypothetical protein